MYQNTTTLIQPGLDERIRRGKMLKEILIVHIMNPNHEMVLEIGEKVLLRAFHLQHGEDMGYICLFQSDSVPD